MTQPAPDPTPPPGDPAPASAPTDPAPAPPPADPPADPPLGPAGKKALDEERAARKALEKRLAELEPLKKLADALGGGQQQPGGKSEVELLNERFAELERTAAEERAARWRLEVAAEKGLTPAQAARLTGGTRDELAADADELLALFPAAAPGPRTPVPDPSQGARGGQPGPDLEAQIAEAQKAGDWRKVLRLNGQKMATQSKK